MRYSLKIRDAKKILQETLESNQPIHFGTSEEYLDYILQLLIHFTHGPVGKDKGLRIYYEFKVRFENQISNHYTYAA